MIDDQSVTANGLSTEPAAMRAASAKIGTYSDYSIPRRLIDMALEWVPTLGFSIVAADASGRVSAWNDHATLTYGWSSSAALGQPLSLLQIGPVDLDESNAIEKRLRRGVPWAGRYVARQRDHQLVTVDAVHMCMTDDEGANCGVVSISSEDAHEVERAVRELVRSRNISQEFDEIRTEIARDIAARLHDDLSQRSHLLLLHTAGLLQRKSADASLRGALERLQDEQKELVGALQSVWQSLRPPLLDEFGVRAALEHLAWVAKEGGVVDVSVEIDEAIDSLTTPLKEVVFLIAQEGVANVVSHSKASRCSLTVTVERSSVIIDVTDNGVGFNAEEGFGLGVMRDRIRRFGGYLEIGPGPNAGCTLRAEIEQTWTVRDPLETLIDPHLVMKSIRDAAGSIVDFVYTDANDAALLALQTTREKFISHRLSERRPENLGSDLFDQYVTTVETGIPLILDAYVVTDTTPRSRRNFDIRAIKVGDSISLTWRDVTDRIQLLKDFRTLAENASDIVCVTGIDGIIAWVSPSITRELGYSVDEVVGQFDGSYLYPAELKLRDASLAESSVEEKLKFELRLRHKDGRFIWFELSIRNIFEDGVLSARINSLRQIHDEVIARDALDRALENYRLLAENASDVVYRTNASGAINWISPSVAVVLGLSSEALIGKRNINLIAPIDVDKYTFWRRQVARGHAISQLELRMMSAQGSYRWMSINPRPLFDDEHRYQGSVISIRDVDQEVSTRHALASAMGAEDGPLPNGAGKAFLDHFCDTVVRQHHFAFSWYARRVGDSSGKFERFASSSLYRHYMKNLDFSWDPACRNCDPAGDAIFTGRVVVIDDFADLADSSPWCHSALERGLRSYITIPITVDGTVHGAWSTYSTTPRAFGGANGHEIERLAHDLGRELERIEPNSVRVAREA